MLAFIPFFLQNLFMPKDLQSQYRQLQKRLSRIGWIATGSVFRRHYTILVGGKPRHCGPYYSLTRKQSARTLTHALTPDQYSFFSKAIANHQNLDNILRRMRKLAVRFIYQSTPSVPRRKWVKSTSKYTR